jgi:glycerol-3-phosphate cytidylyltransferase
MLSFLNKKNIVFYLFGKILSIFCYLFFLVFYKNKKMSCEFRIGYITMTADTIHKGHIHVLKVAKTRCDMLIVGLTTDDTAVKQKRIPMQNYDNRETVLSSIKYVDCVVPHNGEPKSVAWKRLQFDVCFTCAEEYFDKPEFDELREYVPTVTIIGIPRYPDVSSTQVVQDLNDRFLLSTKVLTTGIAGPIYQKDQTVWKTIHFTSCDLLHPTRDNHGFFEQFEQLPRNFKHEEKEGKPLNQYPFIAGVNPGREFLINKYFKDRSWSLFEYSVQLPKYNKTSSSVQIVKKQENLLDFANYIKWERKFPKHTGILVMRFGGISLKEFFNNEITRTREEVTQIITDILQMIEEIRLEGVLHGDIHANNIVVKQELGKWKVSIIDWGWCCSHFFVLSLAERTWLTNRLIENWDKVHFLGSIRNYFPEWKELLSTF